MGYREIFIDGMHHNSQALLDLTKKELSSYVMEFLEREQKLTFYGLCRYLRTNSFSLLEFLSECENDKKLIIFYAVDRILEEKEKDISFGVKPKATGLEKAFEAILAEFFKKAEERQFQRKIAKQAKSWGFIDTSRITCPELEY